MDSPNSVFLEVNSDIDFTPLWEFELDIINFLVEYEQDGIISMDLISESLYYSDSAKFLRETYENWVKKVKQALLDEGSLNQAFLRNGDKFLKIFGIVGLSVAIIGQISILADQIATLCLVGISSLILGLSTIISLLLPGKIAGQWTHYGRNIICSGKRLKSI